MNKSLSLTAVLFATLLYSSSVLAEIPDWYPKNFDMIGYVDQLKGNSIFIDDRKFIISPTVIFATEDNKDADLNELRVKHMIGVNIITINNRRLVDRIWLIPEDDYSKFRPLQ